MTDQTLNQQVDELRTKLGALRRLAIAAQESADEADRPDLVDLLSDTLLHVNDALDQLGDASA